jgi:hypothetical protein
MDLSCDRVFRRRTYFLDDVAGFGVPGERDRVGVAMVGPGGDGVDQFGDAGDGASAQALVGESLEPAFDQVQP